MKHKQNKLVLYFIIISIIVLSSYLYIRVTKEPFTEAAVIYDIIILAGQSNSVGYGTRNHPSNNSPDGYNTTTPLGKILPTDGPNVNIKQLIDNGSTITEGVEPITLFKNKKSASIGHGLSFAKIYLNAHTGRKVLIVGAGFSHMGSAVLSSPPGGGKQWVWNYSGNSLFNNIVTSLQTMKTNNLIHPNSSVKALLWDQGESDMNAILSNGHGANYRDKIKIGFSNVRSNCKTLYPNTNARFPILLTGMCVGQNYFNNVRISGNYPNGKAKEGAYSYRIDMNTYLSTDCVPFLNSNISNVKYVPTDSSNNYGHVLQCDATIDINGKIIDRNNDMNHFSATSQRELGRRFHDVYSTM